jgi:hypothetical protein
MSKMLVDSVSIADPRCNYGEGDDIHKSYTIPVSALVNDPEKMMVRQLEIQTREIEALSVPPGLPLAGLGPAAKVGIDAECAYFAQRDQLFRSIVTAV